MYKGVYLKADASAAGPPLEVWMSGRLSVLDFATMVHVKLVSGGYAGTKLSSGGPVGKDFCGQWSQNGALGPHRGALGDPWGTFGGPFGTIRGTLGSQV